MVLIFSQTTTSLATEFTDLFPSEYVMQCLVRIAKETGVKLNIGYAITGAFSSIVTAHKHLETVLHEYSPHTDNTLESFLVDGDSTEFQTSSSTNHGDVQTRTDNAFVGEREIAHIRKLKGSFGVMKQRDDNVVRHQFSFSIGPRESETRLTKPSITEVPKTTSAKKGNVIDSFETKTEQLETHASTANTYHNFAEEENTIEDQEYGLDTCQIRQENTSDKTQMSNTQLNRCNQLLQHAPDPYVHIENLDQGAENKYKDDCLVNIETSSVSCEQGNVNDIDPEIKLEPFESSNKSISNSKDDTCKSVSIDAVTVDKEESEESCISIKGIIKTEDDIDGETFTDVEDSYLSASDSGSEYLPSDDGNRTKSKSKYKDHTKMSKRKKTVNSPKQPVGNKRKRLFCEESQSSSSGKCLEMAGDCKVTTKKRQGYTSYNLQQKKEVTDYAKLHGLSNAARHFKISKSTVGDWVHTNFDDLMKKRTELGHLHRPGRRLTYSNEIEQKLLASVLKQREQQIPISIASLCNLARAEVSSEGFKASTRWAERFLIRHGLKAKKRCGKASAIENSPEIKRQTEDDKGHFQCHHCGKIFNFQQDLNNHMITHAKNKPYMCSQCSKGFHQKPSLIRHERIHSGEKPFTCNLCEKSFNDASIIRRHVIKAHKKHPKQWQDCVISDGKEG